MQFGYQVASVDLRGHGGSEWAPDGDYSIDAFVGDVQETISQVTSPVVLVGASLGGIAALLAVASDASKIAALVLVDVVPDMEAEGLKRIRDFMSANTDGFANVDEAADAVAAYLPSRPRPSSKKGLENSLRSCPDGRLRWHWDPAFHSGSGARSAAGMLTRMAEAARAVRVPTLLISGRSSEVVSREGAQRLLALLPHGRWVDVDGASHMVAGDSNAAFNAALEDFLRSTLPPCQPGQPRSVNDTRSIVIESSRTGAQ